MNFSPKRISAKIKSLKANDFTTGDSEFVLNSFKIRGKGFKSVPKGFLSIDPGSNSIYMGFDYNKDGIINAEQEAFARFQTNVNPFDESESVIQELADKFSQSKAKGKLVFKPLEVSEQVVFETTFDKESLEKKEKMLNGEVLGSLNYEDLISALSAAENTL